jgi:hypothetical protein
MTGAGHAVHVYSPANCMQPNLKGAIKKAQPPGLGLAKSTALGMHCVPYSARKKLRTGSPGTYTRGRP